ncbi:MAG: hypothetical protein AAGJ29_12330 [Pseudomonadota bacterium]
MAKVTAENLEPIHIRAARALLGFSTKELAALMSGYGNTHMRLRNFEAGRAAPPGLRLALVELMDQCGIELQNGGRPGARVKDPDVFNAVVEAQSSP